MKVGRKNLRNSVTCSFMLIHISTSNLSKALPAACRVFNINNSAVRGNNFVTEVVYLFSVKMLISLNLLSSIITFIITAIFSLLL